MGRHMWGKAAGALVLAVTVAGVSGCGGDAEADGETKPTRAAGPSLDAAATGFQDAVTKQDTEDGCQSKEPGSCWEQMQALMEPARALRKAMNAEKSVGPEFWTEAYALIDTMEEGIAVGDDKGAPVADEVMAKALSNRDEVFGSAHDLVDWLDEHPIA
ncbi:hypothetical protein [Streptomyces prasinus]